MARCRPGLVGALFLVVTAWLAQGVPPVRAAAVATGILEESLTAGPGADLGAAVAPLPSDDPDEDGAALPARAATRAAPDAPGPRGADRALADVRPPQPCATGPPANAPLA